jgi:hypothetical protein
MAQTAQKAVPSTILHFQRNISTELLPSSDKGIQRQCIQPNSPSIVACISCCGNMFTRSLPSNERKVTFCLCLARLGEGETERETKYTLEIGSGAMVYIPSFIKICSDIQRVVGGDSHRHST